MSDEQSGPLEDATAIGRRDLGGMLNAIAAFPDQMRIAWELSRELDIPDRYRATTSACGPWPPTSVTCSA